MFCIKTKPQYSFPQLCPLKVIASSYIERIGCCDYDLATSTSPVSEFDTDRGSKTGPRKQVSYARSIRGVCQSVRRGGKREWGRCKLHQTMSYPRRGWGWGWGPDNINRFHERVGCFSDIWCSSWGGVDVINTDQTAKSACKDSECQVKQIDGGICFSYANFKSQSVSQNIRPVH